MNIHQSNYLPGLVDGVLYGQNERVDEINARQQARQFSDSPLEPNFSPRPVPTKFSLFPVVNPRAPATQPILPYPIFDPEANFNPGTKAPSSGYYQNIDIETMLRFQTVALQRGAGQGVYIPSSTSELYNQTVPQQGQNRTDAQPNPHLFERYTLDQTPNQNVVGSSIGSDMFFNHTRTQLREGR
uniref:Uncharacterized protein n=1 Tax=viral metagenome TaxID=1070528 RepID=A0A6C0I4Y4_9ZZZZ